MVHRLRYKHHGVIGHTGTRLAASNREEKGKTRQLTADTGDGTRALSECPLRIGVSISLRRKIVMVTYLALATPRVPNLDHPILSSGNNT